MRNRPSMEHAARMPKHYAALDIASRGSNQSGMRAYNERLVLALIRQAGSLAKAEIARKTGLSAQTVSVIMRALEADGLVERGPPIRGKVGQPSVPISLAKDGAFFFGLKIGRRSLDLVLTDFLGDVKHRIRSRHPYPTPDGTCAFVQRSIGEIIGRLPEEHQGRVAGLGIALPFQLWNWAETLGVDRAETARWQDRNIAEDIGALHDFPVFVCNDASAACGAELVFGSPDKPRDFLYVFVGFFVGGGLALDGSLYTGSTGNAAALGSMYVPAPSGRMQQLVEVASLITLETEMVSRGEAAAMPWDSPEDWRLPDDVLDNWLNTAAEGIYHAIASSICLIDLNRVLIDGWMPEAMRAALVRRIRDHVSRQSVAGIHPPDVQEGTIGADARALGAASLPLSERFLVERKTFLKGPTP